MKHFILSTLFTLLLPLAACTEKDISGGEPPVGPQTGLRLSARLSQGVVTRALGDPFAAQLEEKRIDRLAFFVHTKEDGFQVYSPVPDDVTDPDQAAADHPNAVYLTGTPAAGYTATVALTAGGGYVADIIAIANLPADYDYKQIVTWEGLQDTVAILATKMPACLPGSTETDLSKRNAFVMYGDVTKELKKEETNTLSFSLQRLVARIDITNEAYEPGTTPANAAANPENSFFLTSARLLHAQPAAYLVPKPDRTPDVVTTDGWPALTGIGTDILYGKPTTKTPTDDPTQEPEMVTVTNPTDANNARLQYAWHTLYTYPNSDTEHAPTALEIKGTFRGTEIIRQIPFVNKDGAAFPVEGNHRYLVRIVKAPGQTDISFNIAVSEWDAVDTVNVKPDQTEVPVITAISTDMTPNLTDPTIKVYDTYYTQDGKIAFDAVCNFAPDVRVKYYNTDNDTWQTTSPYEADWFTLTKSDTELVSLTKGGNEAYKRHIEVSLKSFSTNLPRKAMLLINNGGSEVECDTVYIRHVLTYPGTDFEPVAVAKRDDGSDIIWAPVNVGATKIATNITSTYTEDVFAQCGYYFQWGRSTKFKYIEDKSDVVTPATYPKFEEGYKNEGIYANQFIDGMRGYYSWFKEVTEDDIPPLLKNMIWPRESQPCPAGWCLPTVDETKKLAALMDISNINNNVLMVNSLTFPLGGYRFNHGAAQGLAQYTYYWSCTLDSDVRGRVLYISTSSASGNDMGLTASGNHVRCILDPNP
nr:FISUMP domain-containing protein [Parabacteroides goldsteinii]